MATSPPINITTSNVTVVAAKRQAQRRARRARQAADHRRARAPYWRRDVAQSGHQGVRARGSFLHITTAREGAAPILPPPPPPAVLYARKLRARLDAPPPIFI